MGGHFDLDKKLEEINELESQVNQPDIWNDVNKANELNTKLSYLKKDYNEYNELVDSLKSNIELLEMLGIEFDESVFNSIKNELDDLTSRVKDYEVKTLLTAANSKEVKKKLKFNKMRQF